MSNQNPAAPATGYQTSSGVYPLLWYTSGSPQSQSLTKCDMERWLGYHAGPHGTGWRLHATALPLATGLGLHRGIQLLGEWILDWQTAHPGQRLEQAPAHVVAWAATEAADEYYAKTSAKGLLLTETDATAQESIETVINEQRTLIEGMTWTWAIGHLPTMLANYRLVEVEAEEALILDCTCGLGDQFTDIDSHKLRGCSGIAHMAKADQLWQRFDRQTLTYVEFKGWGSINASKEAKWEHSAQLLANMEAASRRHGVGVDEAFVVILLKGWRGRDKGASEFEPKYQHSPLCYGYYDAGNPPIREAEWQASYKWIDEKGKNHNLPRSFTKVPIWLEQFGEQTYPLTPVRDGASRVETWVRSYLTEKQFAQLFKVLGPYPRPTLRVPLAIKGIVAEERRFRGDVELLREHGAVMPSDPMVDDLIARSWECTSYDNTKCQFRFVCNREPGWEDPEASGRYVRRTPHHAPEAAAVRELGVELPIGDDEVEEEAGDGE